MYLLQQSQSTSFFVYLLAISISSLIFYFLVRFAVAAALKDREKADGNINNQSIRIQNRLLVELLMHHGVTYERIEELIDPEKQPFEKYEKGKNFEQGPVTKA